MQLSSIYLIAVLEVAVVLLILIAILFFQNRSLRSLVSKMRARMTQLVEDLKTAQQKQPPQTASLSQGYAEFIDKALEETRDHHESLDPERDIILDLAPDTQHDLRSVALRYAILLAEKEATAKHPNEAPDWTILSGKYQQIFDFYEDYAPNNAIDGEENQEKAKALEQELLNTKKEINDLKKFKAFYFDLKRQWEQNSNEVNSHFSELSAIASDTKEPKKFGLILENYHAIYQKIETTIANGEAGNIEGSHDELSEFERSEELRRLQNITTKQHQLINQLQTQLRDENSEKGHGAVVSDLREQLGRQQRLMNESDTCLQLMENELHTAHKEIEHLKSRLGSPPSLESQVQSDSKQNREANTK